MHIYAICVIVYVAFKYNNKSVVGRRWQTIGYGLLGAEVRCESDDPRTTFGTVSNGPKKTTSRTYRKRTGGTSTKLLPPIKPTCSISPSPGNRSKRNVSGPKAR